MSEATETRGRAEPAADRPQAATDPPAGPAEVAFTVEHLRTLAPHAVAREVARREAQAVAELASRFGPAFDRAVELIHGLAGRLMVLGAGKSGQVAAKVAATLTSTGTPSTFVHPADAVHGDLGLLRPDDAVLVFSKSGGTAEICRLVPLMRRVGVPVVAVTAHPASELGRHADIVIDTGASPEASPWGMVPTTSTTVALVVGDALAVALLVRRGFAAEDFAELHPGGVIGRALTTRVREVMHRGDGLPRVHAGAPLREGLGVIISGRLGMTTVVDDGGRLVGVVTDGDLKRILIKHAEPLELVIASVMSPRPRTIDGGATLAAAVQQMESNRPGPITSLVVVDGEGRPEGVVHLHDCLRP